MNASLPVWVEWTVALLLVLSGTLALLAAWGLVRLQDFFQRLHPPALGFTGAAWCAALACAVYFSAAHEHLSLRSGIIVVVLVLTVPVTTVLLARSALFRFRQQGHPNIPPALTPLDRVPLGEEGGPPSPSGPNAPVSASQGEAVQAPVQATTGDTGISRSADT